jgi:hypothetical protein
MAQTPQANCRSAAWLRRMPEIRTVTTLKRKRAEIAASIKLYEKHLAQARSDLSYVAAAIRIFEASGRPSDIARYVDTYRLFKRGESWAIYQAALSEANGPLDTRELSFALMRAKGMDTADTVLAILNFENSPRTKFANQLQTSNGEEQKRTGKAGKNKK